ncbi:hypothetical protein ACRRTK_009958 [Alexandromys fortis]
MSVMAGQANFHAAELSLPSQIDDNSFPSPGSCAVLTSAAPTVPQMGIIQDGKIIFMPNGFITQCPNLNRKTRLGQLENCHCEKTCQVSGLLYRDQDSWVDGDNCRNCTCKSGAVECRRMSCPPLNCSPDSLPVHISGQCCKVCRPKCIYGGKVLAEGQRILTKSCRECRDGVLVKMTEACPPLNCSKKDHILPENQCCRVCRGHNFCAEAPKCGENSECKNWNTKATCECKSGYISVQGNSAFCEGESVIADVTRCDEGVPFSNDSHSLA